MRELPQRKPIRLAGYDYRRNGAYFVTICTKNRAQLFGTIPPADAMNPGRPQFKLSNIGEIVHTAIVHNNRNGVIIDCFVVMPDHIHMIVCMSSETGDRGRSPLQTIIRNMKAYITKQIGFSPWQKSFHDRIIRDKSEYLRIVAYIENNPIAWQHDRFGPDAKQ